MQPETNPAPFFRSTRGLCATIATIITIISSAAYFWVSHMFGGANVVIRALACLALPGFSVGVMADILATGNIHGARRIPALVIGFPLNWLLYYVVGLGVAHFRKSRREG
jgi:hypothetical protein